ncbi:MAG: GHKL domain-containing protein [Sphaerochaetaceae bacterium]|nr:GHKL domain-containing protein [Sphaerochaetaceae bacterium]
MSRISSKVLKNISKLSDEQILTYMDNLTEEIENRDTVLDATQEGYLLADSSMRVVYLNETACTILPVINSQSIRKPVYVNTLIKDKSICAFIKHCIQTRDVTAKYEYRDRSPLYGERDISINVISFTKNGSAIFEIRDITYILKFKREYTRNEGLAAMTTMAAGVAHEIKNPLASMSIYVQLLARKLDKNGSITKEEAQKTIEVLNEEIERLNKMAVDFLYAVKPVNATFSMENVNKCILSSLDLARAELEENGIITETDLAVSLPNVKMDPALIQQCLLNLIRNSMQARKEGQKELKINIRSYMDSNTVCMAVEDNGCGMSEDQMLKIFEPYYTTKASGTGLGLTNIYKIVKEHGGEVTVNSKLNEGTVFTISLPVPDSERYRLG